MELEPLLEERAYKSLKIVIAQTLKFDPSQYSDSFLKRRLSIRMRAKDVTSYLEYEKLFQKNAEEQKKLWENMTIHVTEFFRDPDFWDFFKEKIVKEIIKRTKEKDNIKIWSAGCSSGQEAISIMINFLEINSEIKNKLQIIGTDISEIIIAKAISAEYEPYEYKTLPEYLQTKYFDKKDSNLILKDEYKKIFKFIKHDVLLDEPLKNIDAILFRNTVIYFAKEAKERLYQKFYEKLNNNGFFILGKTETLTGPAKEKFTIFDIRERIFEKKQD